MKSLTLAIQKFGPILLKFFCRQADRQTDRHIDKQTDRQGKNYMPSIYRCWGIKSEYFDYNMYFTILSLSSSIRLINFPNSFRALAEKEIKELKLYSWVSDLHYCNDLRATD